jgi:hypothetical protein
MDSPHSDALHKVLAYFKLNNHYSTDRDTIMEGLHRMGYRLEAAEVDRVIETISNDPNLLTRDSVIASQMDWAYMQRNTSISMQGVPHIDLDITVRSAWTTSCVLRDKSPLRAECTTSGERRRQARRQPSLASAVLTCRRFARPV